MRKFEGKRVQWQGAFLSFEEKQIVDTQHIHNLFFIHVKMNPTDASQGGDVILDLDVLLYKKIKF